jgi:hypothetical protein
VSRDVTKSLTLHGLSKRVARSPLAVRVLAATCAWVLRAIGGTWRVERRGPDPLGPGQPAILGAFWHRNILVAAHHFRDRGFSVPVSRSRDGDWIAAVLNQLGYAAPPRGSSSNGGTAALRALMRLVRSGTTISIQTDGPRGPARQSKTGIIALARLTGAKIHPIAFSASPCIRFRSWDATLLPLPFARVVCEFGTPLEIPADCDEADEERLRKQLDSELDSMTDRLDAEFELPARVPGSS